MGLTIDRNAIPERRMKNTLVYLGTIDLDSSYPAGGYRADVVQTRITRMHLTNIDTTNRYEYNPTTDKIMVFVKSTNAEVANGVDLSGDTGIAYEALVYFE